MKIDEMDAGRLQEWFDATFDDGARVYDDGTGDVEVWLTARLHAYATFEGRVAVVALPEPSPYEAYLEGFWGTIRMMDKSDRALCVIESPGRTWRLHPLDPGELDQLMDYVGASINQNVFHEGYDSAYSGWVPPLPWWDFDKDGLAKALQDQTDFWEWFPADIHGVLKAPA